jgi:hypothetical protein
VLAYAPDPLLYVDSALRYAPPSDEPELLLDPEYTRVITPGQPRDEDGSEALVRLAASPDDPRKFLLPLPAGVGQDDPRLFGLWAYELRFGHITPWSTAHARFGRPLRVGGIAHPAPALPVGASWETLPPLFASAPGALALKVVTTTEIVATAPYAQPVLSGRRVGDGFPRTLIGFLLYAQVMQADGSGYRNILIAQRTAEPIPVQLPSTHVDEGRAVFSHSAVAAALGEYGLPASAPLSVVAVEVFAGIRFDGNVREIGIPPRGTPPADWPQPPNLFDAKNLGRRRILRTSALTPIAPMC